jgi:CheY-like chemotaxis protein
MPVPGATLPKCKILVLDDEKSIAEMLCEMLNILGHEPTLCTASPQAVELIQSQEFDLVLSDYRMPIMNGQEFYNAVKASKPALAQRIIFLTGDVMNQETQSFLDSIGNPHLSKPFQLTHVEAVIARLLQNHTAKANVSALNN